MQDSPTVIELTAKRIKENSEPQNRKDSYKVGLVIEGGIFRGVISAGMCEGLEALNGLNAFDGIYAVSAGACNAAYFTAGQAYLGTVIYTQDLISDRKFINLPRIFKGRPPIEVKYLTHTIFKKVHKLNWRRIVNSKVPFHIYVTSAKEGKTVDFHAFQNQNEILDALYWSCRLPVVCGLPAKVENKYYTDGEILVGGIPLKQALDDGCTHVLILMTNNQGEEKRISTLERLMSDYILSHILRFKGFKDLVRRYNDGYKSYVFAMNKIRESSIKPALPRVETIHLDGKNISRLETNPVVLREAAMDGYNVVMKRFERYGLQPKKDTYARTSRS